MEVKTKLKHNFLLGIYHVGQSPLDHFNLFDLTFFLITFLLLMLLLLLFFGIVVLVGAIRKSLDVIVSRFLSPFLLSFHVVLAILVRLDPKLHPHPSSPLVLPRLRFIR